jgi:hypothetical protein
MSEMTGSNFEVAKTTNRDLKCQYRVCGPAFWIITVKAFDTGDD